MLLFGWIRGVPRASLSRRLNFVKLATAFFVGGVCFFLRASSLFANEPGLGLQIFSTRGKSVEVEISSIPPTVVFTDDIYLASPGSSRFIGSNRDTGAVVNLGSFPADTELIFKIVVRDTGDTFFTGPGERNPDGIAHAIVEFPGPGVAIVRFEDLFGGGDRSFTDAIFRVTGVSDKVPVLIIPGILGSWSTELFEDQSGNVNEFQANQAELIFAGARQRTGRCTVLNLDCRIEMPENWTLDPFFGEYEQMRAALSSNGFIPIDVPYDWRLPVSLSAQLFLKTKIDEVKRRFRVSQVNIVAHSMGGLLARAYIQSPDYTNRKDVHKLAMLGTPNHGSATAYYPWEGGQFFGDSFGLDSTEVQELLLEQMKEAMGLGRISDREFIVAGLQSIRDLLPTYRFLVNILKNGGLVSLKKMCAQNTFLNKLNADLESLVRSGVQIQTFAGLGRGTPLGFWVRRREPVDCSEGRFLATVWPDGKPVGKPILGVGDGTVVIGSVELRGIPLVLKAAEHTCIETDNCLNIEFIPDVLSFLSSS